MTRKWGSGAILAICLLLAVGCRTTQPDVKPRPEPERYAGPPPERRYEVAGYPKQAFDAPVDPMKRDDGKIMQAGGMGMRPGGMGGSMSASRP